MNEWREIFTLQWQHGLRKNCTFLDWVSHRVRPQCSEQWVPTHTHRHRHVNSPTPHIACSVCRNWKWNVIYSNFNTAALRLSYIPAVAVIVDGGRALLAKVGVAVLDPEDMRGKRNEPSGTGASTTWPHPIVWSGITRLVIVSSCLMSLADSGHVSGKRGSWELWKPGECETDLQGKWSGHKAGLLPAAESARADSTRCTECLLSSVSLHTSHVSSPTAFHLVCSVHRLHHSWDSFITLMRSVGGLDVFKTSLFRCEICRKRHNFCLWNFGTKIRRVT